MTTYWIGVASREHVKRGVEGGFCQLSHGKASPLRRLKTGDRLIYYSPRERMGEGEPIQSFTAIGEIAQGEPVPADMGGGMGGGFVAYRRAVNFFAASDAPIRPLLPLLSFTRDRPNWGVVLRRGLFSIEATDYQTIAKAMGAAEA